MAKAKADAQCYLVESSDSEESIVTEAMSEPEWTSLIPEDKKKIVGAKAKSMCKRKFQGEPGPGSYNITIKTNLKSPLRSRRTKIAPTSTVRPSTKSRSQPQTTWWNYNHVKNQEDDTPWWNYNHVKNQDDDKTWWNYNHGKNQDDETWWNDNHVKSQERLNDEDVHMEDVFS